MTLLSLLASVALLVPQTVQQPTGGFTFAGQAVSLQYPPAESNALPEGFLDWKGWGYRKGALSVRNETFPANGDWSAVQAKATPASNAAVWREKVILFTRADLVDQDAEGVLRRRRSLLTDPEVKEALASIARWTSVVAARTDGAVSLVPEVAIDADTIQGTLASTKPVYDEVFATSYLEARVNGGTFEAEDKVYRGPYNGIVLIVPPGSASSKPVDTVVHGMPVRLVPLASPVAADCQLDEALDSAFTQQVLWRAKDQGYTVAQDGQPLDVKSLVGFGEPSAEEIISRATGPSRLPDLKPFASSYCKKSWKGQDTSVTLATDPDRGSVLHVLQKGIMRTGGLELPLSAGGLDSSQTTLTFWAKAKSTDPLAIHAIGDKAEAWYVLGQDFAAPAEAPTPASIPTGFVADGTWKQVSLDLKPVGAVRSLTIEPTPRSVCQERRYPYLIEYDFDGFALTNDSVPVVAASADPAEEQAKAAAKAFASGQSFPELAPMLSADSEFVMLNAAHAYEKVKDPVVVPTLAKMTRTINLPLQGVALRALANQGGDEATTAMRKLIVRGVNESGSALAGYLLAQNPPNNLSADLSLLINQLSWRSRVMTVDALGKLPGSAAGITMTTFIYHSDPAVKLAVTMNADPASEFEMRRVEWSAVNEPWDGVRLWSATKLIEGKLPEFKTEGYRVVRDDSVMVRLEFVKWMGDHPSDAHVPSLLLALSDTSYRVRATALDSLSRQGQPVKIDDLKPVLSDKFPQVQAALARLAKAKALKLPEATVSAMKSSPIKEVSDLAGQLG